MNSEQGTRLPAGQAGNIEFRRLLPRLFYSLVPAFLLAIVFYLNISLYYQPRFENIDGKEINADLLGQLKFLEKELHNGAGGEMQGVYPEGFVFMNVLYGLAWCDMGNGAEPGSSLRKQALKESAWAYREIIRDGSATFDRHQLLPSGAFYFGWSNYLLAKKLGLQKPGERDTTEVNLFDDNCDLIASVLDSLDTPYPESYIGMAWPADAMLCLAALAEHDRISKPSYETTMSDWITRVKQRLDSNGLIPHQVDPESGKPLQNARGCSQSLMLCFLGAVDSVFAQEQFSIYKEKFLDSRMGLPGVREYPKGTSGSGDVDSGPVIFGIGGAASVVGLRTMALFKEEPAAIGLRNSIEAFGCGKGTEEKKYLFGILPMADAFIAWVNATEINQEQALQTDKGWKGWFQFYSLLVVLLMTYWLWRIWRSIKNRVH